MNENITNLLNRVLTSTHLKTVFQPIVDLDDRDVIGHQAFVLVQGQTALLSPERLLGLASSTGQTQELNRLYRQKSLDRYIPHDTGMMLFFNASPELPEDVSGLREEFEASVNGLFPFKDLVPVIRCRCKEFDEVAFGNTVSFYKSMGMQVALEVNAKSLDSHILWGSVLPDFLKLESSLIKKIEVNTNNQKRVSEALMLCEEYGVLLIAEGIETHLEYETLLRLGVSCGQGDFLSRRARVPVCTISAPHVDTLMEPVLPFEDRPKTLSDLVADRVTLAAKLPATEAMKLFVEGRGFDSAPVVRKQKLVGELTSTKLLTHAASEHGSGNSRVGDLCESAALVFPEDTGLWEFCQFIQAKESSLETNCVFLENKNEEYVGRVYLRDVLSDTLDFQYQAMRHANPMSGLPGHVPLDEVVIRLLEEKALFVVASIGINELKAFNDRYGYVQGDRVILQVAQLLKERIDPELDFVAHVGGDNFAIVFKSSDWFERCESLINQIDRMAERFYQPEDREQGGVCSVDRQGNEVFSPFFSLCIGAVPVFPGKFSIYHEVFSVASEVKERAQSTYGGAIYIDQRNYRGPTGELTMRLC